MMNQGGNRGAMNFGRNRAKINQKRIKFVSQMWLCGRRKEELVEVVDFLKIHVNIKHLRTYP